MTTPPETRDPPRQSHNNIHSESTGLPPSKMHPVLHPVFLYGTLMSSRLLAGLLTGDERHWNIVEKRRKNYMDTHAMQFWMQIILPWLKVGLRIVWKDFYTIQENGTISGCWMTLKAIRTIEMRWKLLILRVTPLRRTYMCGVTSWRTRLRRIGVLKSLKTNG